MKAHRPAQLPALTRLFSAAVFRKMAKNGRCGLFSQLLRQTDLVKCARQGATVGDTFDAAFSILKTAGYRSEYIYRAAITQKILMETHSLRTAVMLNEFRVGNCKADVVILNSGATVYEIKSERDSLARLVNQIENYKRVFATVNVITSEGHIEGVQNIIPDDVGIMCLSKCEQITTIREASTCPSRICPVTAFESLRSAEGSAILQAMGVMVPEVPNTQKRTAMRALFSKLEAVELHAQMVATLKQTRDLAPIGDFVDCLPKSLQAAAFSIPIRRCDHSRLINTMATPLNVAMTWG